MTIPDSPALASRLQINDDVLFQELNGEAVLLNLKTGVYLGLDLVGTRVWQLLADKPALQDVIEKILSEFDVEREQCTADLLALTSDMSRHELITLIPSADSP